MDQVQIGKFIKEKRLELNMTQKDLADYLLVSDRAVSKWENGRSMMDISLLVPLSDLFNISVDELLRAAQGTSQSEAPNLIQYAQITSMQKQKIINRRLTLALLLSAIALTLSQFDDIIINEEITSFITGMCIGFGLLLYLFTFLANNDIENKLVKWKKSVFKTSK